MASISDDGKDLFDFMPGGPLPEGDDVERPEPDAGDPALQARVLEALKTVRDPEIPVNLVDLGLIYELMVRRDGTVYIEMTLTTPACPVAGSLAGPGAAGGGRRRGRQRRPGEAGLDAALERGTA